MQNLFGKDHLRLFEWFDHWGMPVTLGKALASLPLDEVLLGRPPCNWAGINESLEELPSGSHQDWANLEPSSWYLHQSSIWKWEWAVGGAPLFRRQLFSSLNKIVNYFFNILEGGENPLAMTMFTGSPHSSERPAFFRSGRPEPGSRQIKNHFLHLVIESIEGFRQPRKTNICLGPPFRGTDARPAAVAAPGLLRPNPWSRRQLSMTDELRDISAPRPDWKLLKKGDRLTRLLDAARCTLRSGESCTEPSAITNEIMRYAWLASSKIDRCRWQKGGGAERVSPDDDGKTPGKVSSWRSIYDAGISVVKAPD